MAQWLVQGIEFLALKAFEESNHEWEVPPPTFPVAPVSLYQIKCFGKNISRYWKMQEAQPCVRVGKEHC